ncbi:MAG TPA: MBL fold metallo-hydrolase [Desulfuromonadales bacterium]|nr:MBL fold metallo-hydrolase [Desulfuromonadales bacterium]
MSVDLSFHNLSPTFAGGLIDDPLLLVRVVPSGRFLMFDCGQVHHLANRIFSRLDALFISHAHMDHWMGIDTVIRCVHAAPRTIDLFGPPGLADKLESKLAGYDWNLAEDYWASFRVHEVFPDHICCDRFCGPEGFRRLAQGARPHGRQRPICRTPQFEVLAATCQHRVASLAFRINDRPGFLIDKEKLAALDLVPGPWIGDLKGRVLRDEDLDAGLTVCRRGPDGTDREVWIQDVPALLRQIERPQRPAAIGYVSDVGFTDANRATIVDLMAGVDLLVCECTFLQDGRQRARNSHHLCTDDVNWLLRELRPRFFLPMHLSKTYSRRSAELYQELVPPEGTQLLQLPLRRTPRPLLAAEMPWQLNESG